MLYESTHGGVWLNKAKVRHFSFPPKNISKFIFSKINDVIADTLPKDQNYSSYTNHITRKWDLMNHIYLSRLEPTCLRCRNFLLSKITTSRSTVRKVYASNKLEHKLGRKMLDKILPFIYIRTRGIKSDSDCPV